MIYAHAIEMEPKEMEGACPRACLECRRGAYSVARPWISVTQLSKLLELLLSTELEGMPLCSNANLSQLCYDAGKDLYLRPWSVTFEKSDGLPSYEAFTTCWDDNVEKCVEPTWDENVANCVGVFWQTSMRGEESCPVPTLGLLIPDRSEYDWSPQWLNLPFLLALFLLPAVKFAALRL